MREYLTVAAYILASVVLIFGAGDLLCRHACWSYEQATNRPTKWMTLSDCYIWDGGQWWSSEEYKAAVTAREGLQGADRPGLEYDY